MTEGSVPPAPPTHTSESAHAEPSHADYLAYRVRQARELLALIPRDAVRPLYRRAIADGRDGVYADPLDRLVRFCERILPLPPFEVWLADLTANPDAHLVERSTSADDLGANRATTLATRSFSHDGTRWVARLLAFPDGSTWRGYICFENDTAETCLTAPVFREHGPGEVRERFGSFDEASLEAFLRSAKP